MKKAILVLLASILLMTALAGEKGKVYLVIGSDTSIWEGLSTSVYDNRYFLSALYSDPGRNGFAVMDTTFRHSLRDSYGTPMKMTWWMMAGNVFELSKNCNIPIRNNITLHLMKKYHLDAIENYDDQLSLHYHTYYWSDPQGDGTYKWEMAPEFLLNLDDYERTLSTFLIEDDVFPVSFRSGWMYMDEGWQAYQERFIPFDMSDCWTPIPDGSVPFHPSAENYREKGDLKQWRVRSLYFTVLPQINYGLNIMFREAAAGKDQMVCYWAHLPENNFLTAMDSLDRAAHRLSKEYGVDFVYCKDTEAMRLWINPEDTIAPVLQLNEIVEGDNIRYEMVTDGPVFQLNEPFITVKNKYEEYKRLDCTISGENRWETIEGVPADEIAKVAVAVCDSVGNQAKAHLDYLPDDIFIDDRDDAFIEGPGNWQDYNGSTQLWDLNARVLNGRGSFHLTPSIEEDLPYSISFHGPGSSTDSVRIRVDNGSVRDTVLIDKTLLGRDKWQHAGFFDLTPGTGNTITFENLDSGLTMGIDVVRITPLVADKHFVLGQEMLTFGDVSVKDTAVKYLSLSNRGKEALTVSRFSVFGSKLTLDVDVPFTLAPMESNDIAVKFYTDDFCDYSDVLTIETDDPRHAGIFVPIFANADTYYKIVDNEDAGAYSEHGGSWNYSSALGWNGSSRWVNIDANGNHADFNTEVGYSGTYDLQIHIPSTTNAHNHANCILLIDGVPQDTLIRDQNEDSGGWTSIGEYDLPKDVEITLRIQDNGGNTNPSSVLRADAVKFVLIEEKYVSAIYHAGIPQEFALFPNYPNPFNPATTLYFALPEDGEVTIEFFDLQGKPVDKAIIRTLQAGYHHVRWSPSGLASGVYLYRVSTSSATLINKCTFLK